MWNKFTSPFKSKSRDTKLGENARTPSLPDGFAFVNLDARSPTPSQAHSLETVRYRITSLGLMTIEVEVYRQGDVHSPIVETSRVHIATIARPAVKVTSNDAKNYSWDQFLEVFDRQLDENPVREPTQMKYGKVGYFTVRGDHKEVGNQKGFEKALDHLFQNRGTSDLLKFTFQPEHQDKMNARHAAEKFAAEKVARDIAASEKAAEEKKAAELAKLSPKSHKFSEPSVLAKETSRPGTSDGDQISPVEPSPKKERTSPVLAFRRRSKK